MSARARALLAQLSATDRLLLAYLVALAGLALATLARPAAVVAGSAGLALMITGSARWGTRSRWGRRVHDFLPIASVIGTFTLSGPVIAAANPRRWDAALASLDGALFGALPAAWFGLLDRPVWLVDAAAILYFSYYLIPLAMGVALYRTGRRADFDRMVFAIVASFLVTFVCYFALPALGPRVSAAREATLLGGGAMSEQLRRFLRLVELNELDAFPSGHTTLALVYLGLGWRLLPRWRLALSLLVAGIVFSTVYLSLHYVVDLVAGALLAAALPFVWPLLHRCVTLRAVAWAAPTT